MSAGEFLPAELLERTRHMSVRTSLFCRSRTGDISRRGALGEQPGVSAGRNDQRRSGGLRGLHRLSLEAGLESLSDCIENGGQVVHARVPVAGSMRCRLFAGLSVIPARASKPTVALTRSRRSSRAASGSPLRNSVAASSKSARANFGSRRTRSTTVCLKSRLSAMVVHRF